MDEAASPADESAEELYENAPCGYLTTDPNGVITRINRTLLDWLGYAGDEIVGRRTFQSLLSVGGRVYYETHYGPLLMLQGTVREIAVELVRRDGSRLPALVNATVRVDADGRPVSIRTMVFDATARRGYERELVAAREDAERSEQRLQVIHRVVSRCAAAVTRADVVEVLESEGRSAVAAVRGEVRLADAAEAAADAAEAAADDAAAAAASRMIEIEDRDVRVPLTAGDQVLGVLALSFAAPPQLGDDDLLLLRTLGDQAGQALQRADLFEAESRLRQRAEFLATLARRMDEKPGLRQRAERLVASLVPLIARGASVALLVDDQPAAVASLGDADWDVQVPLRVQTGVIGELRVALANPAPTPGMLRFLVDVADIAGIALENGRLYDEERENALILQRGLLAEAPPNDPRVTVATYYQPAGDGLEVGGDWYDVFPVGAHCVALVVGDVVGRGIRAASAMGQLRSAVRALAAADPAPSAVLERLDRFVDRFEAGRMSTVAYGELDLSTGVLRYACAGHPPPLLIDPDGTHRFLWEGRSPSLAAYLGSPTRAAAEVVLKAGSRLLFYTDGLVERRGRNLLATIERLGEEAAQRHRSPMAGLLPALVGLLVDGRRADDVCILGLSYGREEEFERAVPADLGELRHVRDDLRRWLASVDVTGDEREALLLACSEVVANAIEHGYRNDVTGTVWVHAARMAGGIELTVRDEGSWREPDPTSDRGRGMMMIGALMDRVVVERDGGTVVTMRRRVLSPEAAA